MNVFELLDPNILCGVGFFLIALGVTLSLIPAGIARKKGFNPFLWWLFGLVFFFPALICVIIIPPKEDR